jgi:O-antigen/teichoic acid export membrane protein
MVQFTPAQKLAKEATISFVGLGYGHGFRYIFTALLARWVGLEYLGIYSLANSITRIAEVIGRAGLDEGILRSVGMKDTTNEKAVIYSEVRAAVKMGLVFALLMMTVQIVLSDWLVTKVFTGTSLLKTVIIINAITLPFCILTSISAFTTQGFRLLKYKIFVSSILNPTILVLSLIATYFLFSNELAIIIPTVISTIVGFFVIVKFLRRLTGVHFGSVIKAKFDWKLLKFSTPLMFAMVIGTILNWTDIMMLGFFMDIESVGLYHPAARTAGLIRVILLAFSGIYMPMLAQYFSKNDPIHMQMLIKLVARWILTLAIPCLILLLTFPSKVMLLFGVHYVEAQYVLQILAIAIFIQTISGIGGSTLVVTGYPKVNLYNALVALGVNIGLNIILIPQFGITGAALATLISLLIIAVARIVEIRLLNQLTLVNLKYLKPIIAGAVTTIVILFARPIIMEYHTLITLACAIFLIVLVYFSVLWIQHFDQDDRDVWSAILAIMNTTSFSRIINHKQ